MATLSVQVSDTADDWDESGVGMEVPGYVYIYPRSFGFPAQASYRCSGMRFTNVTIPRNSTINSAYLSLYRHFLLDPAKNMNVKIYGNDVGDAHNFVDEADVIGRARTTAFVPWVEDGIGTGWINSPDFAGVIQEIVNRGDFAEGHDIVVLLIANTDVDKQFQAYAWDKDNARAPKIYLDYEPPPATPTVTTDPASGEAVASATLNGTLDHQGAAASDCGFEWGLDTGYGTITSPQSKTTGETFSQALGGLQPGTTYHFRAFATNPVGTSYGADRSFTTALVITKAYALARQEL